MIHGLRTLRRRKRRLHHGNSYSERPGFFRRFFDAMMAARQRQAEREIERYLRNSKFTDEAEREIERRFLSTPRAPLKEN